MNLNSEEKNIGVSDDGLLSDFPPPHGVSENLKKEQYRYRSSCDIYETHSINGGRYGLLTANVEV